MSKNKDLFSKEELESIIPKGYTFLCCDYFNRGDYLFYLKIQGNDGLEKVFYGSFKITNTEVATHPNWKELALNRMKIAFEEVIK